MENENNPMDGGQPMGQEPKQKSSGPIIGSIIIIIVLIIAGLYFLGQRDGSPVEMEEQPPIDGELPLEGEMPFGDDAGLEDLIEDEGLELEMDDESDEE